MAIFYIYRGKFLEEPSLDLLSRKDRIFGNHKTRFLYTGSWESLPQGLHGFEFPSGMNGLDPYFVLVCVFFFDLYDRYGMKTL